VWTWNAIGKAAGAWNLTADANESKKGFLLNHLISEELPATDDGDHLSNSDPITGQAAWYDVKVRVYKADPQEDKVTSPQFDVMNPVPGQAERKSVLSYFAGSYLSGNKGKKK